MEPAVLDDSVRPMTVLRRIALLLLVVWALGGAPARAAETTAAIVGYVRTANGTPLAGASVIALSPSGRYEVRSDAQGRFTLLAVTADTYAITVDARGFAVQQLRGITVNPGATARVDFALAAQRTEAREPEDAIYTASLLRFRPIIMTTMAAMLGAMPLAFGTGDGAEMRQPLGIAIVGGLLVSQVLTLYTTPVMYLYLDRFGRWCSALWSRVHPYAPHAPPAAPAGNL